MANKQTQSVEIGLSTIVDEVPISFKASYDLTTLAMEVKSCRLDLAQTAQERFNNMNVVLPEDSSKLMIAKFGGSISKTDRNKNPDPSGEYRLIKFEGEMENIEIPIPIISDIQIDRAFFYYLYHSPQSTRMGNDFKDQTVFLGCKLSVKKDTDLYAALTDASLTGAYFLSNNASIVYFDFSGQINVGKIIEALFGVTAVKLVLDIKSAGLFRIAKANKTQKLHDTKTNPQLPDCGITYLDALKQIAHLQGSTEGPTGNVSVSSLMPKSFPLGEETISTGSTTSTKIGIKCGDQIDTDFSDQFAAAFASDEVTGICFWAMVDFNQASFFNSLITIGYGNQQINSLILYGFRTQQGKTPAKPASSYFYAQLPGITLFNFLTFGGIHGRKGILFKYRSDLDQYELNGSIAFSAFDKPFLFEGDLVVNDRYLKAELSVSVGSIQSIDAPLGMTGINFGELFFCIHNTFAQKEPPTASRLDLAIGGFIQLNLGISVLRLAGNLVFDNNEIRLVLVSIDVSQALKLSDFVSGVLGLKWEWLDDITRQIGFISGSMYYLSIPESQKSNEHYTFKYENPILLKSNQVIDVANASTIRITEYRPGYHVHADLLLFEQYVFAIDLSVEKEGVLLSGSFAGTYENDTVRKSTTIKAFFISFDSPSLRISTIRETSFSIGIDNIRIFNTNLGSVTVGYSGGIFRGSYLKSDIGFGFDWQWTTKKVMGGGFSITKINGIDSREMDAIEAIMDKLNKMNPKGGCSAITKSLFKNFKSSFSPALQEGKSPTEKGDGSMSVPLAIAYKFTAGKTVLYTDTINLTLDVTIPGSLPELPEAIFKTLADNLVGIVGQLLDDDAVYKVLAIEMTKKGLGSLAGKMLCKLSNKKAGFELAEAIEALLEAGMVLGDIGVLLELEGILYALGFIGVAVAAVAFVALIVKIWDSASKQFNSEEDKKKAQEKLDSIKGPINDKIRSINERMKQVAGSIQIERLDVSLDEKGQYLASWAFPENRILGENETLSYQLVFLRDPIGTPSTNLSTIPTVGFELMEGTTRSFDWAKLRQTDPDFQMNASIQTSVTGSFFMTPEAISNLKTTIDTLQKTSVMLDEIGDSLEGAVEFNEQLKKFNADMNNFIDHGIRSEMVYATCSDTFIIGGSALGINTKL